MNEFTRALAQFFGQKKLAKISSTRVGLAGAGGLGSNCAQLLVRSGFRHFTIIDFDRVEVSNLNRQFFFLSQLGQPKVEALKQNLLQINPDLVINTKQLRIEPDNVAELFKKCDVIIEALDQPTYKRLLVESYFNSSKLLVAASGIAGWGGSDEIKIRQLKKNFYLVGDLVSEVSKEHPPVAPSVVVAAAKQADVVLNYVLTKGDEEDGK
jgi:sulfur carrier protein ThiS adenylyltransferase